MPVRPSERLRRLHSLLHRPPALHPNPKSQRVGKIRHHRTVPPRTRTVLHRLRTRPAHLWPALPTTRNNFNVDGAKLRHRCTRLKCDSDVPTRLQVHLLLPRGTSLSVPREWQGDWGCETGGVSNAVTDTYSIGYAACAKLAWLADSAFSRGWGYGTGKSKCGGGDVASGTELFAAAIAAAEPVDTGGVLSGDDAGGGAGTGMGAD